MVLKTEYSRRYIVTPSCSSKLYWENRKSRQQYQLRALAHSDSFVCYNEESSSDDEFIHLCEANTRPLTAPAHVRKHEKYTELYNKHLMQNQRKNDETPTMKEGLITSNAMIDEAVQTSDDYIGDNSNGRHNYSAFSSFFIHVLALLLQLKLSLIFYL